MKNLRKINRENLRQIHGGYGPPVSDGMGGWYCPNRNEMMCLVGCNVMCMSGTKCKPSDCLDPIYG